MSAILIKNTNMPETCDYCPLSHYYPNTMRVWCNAKVKLLIDDYDPMQADHKIKKPKWCPLEEEEPRTTIADIKAEMASEIIEQIEKMRQKEPYYFLPNRDAYNLFQKIVEDFRDGKGAWAERKKET